MKSKFLAAAARLLILRIALLSLSGSLQAWEPNAKDLDAAINAGDFGGYQANLSAWLNQRVPADAGNISEASVKSLLKNSAFANALGQWQIIAKCGAGKIGTFVKAAPPPTGRS